MAENEKLVLFHLDEDDNNSHFTMMDTPDNIILQDLRKSGIPITLTDTFTKEGYPYHLLHISVANKDADRLLELANAIPDAMELNGYSDYSEACDYMVNILTGVEDTSK